MNSPLAGVCVYTLSGRLTRVAAAGVMGPAWLLVLGLTRHGFKDLWQHRRQYVANTRWWPPFCLVADWSAQRYWSC